jgi:hypothetical protein
MASRRLYGFPMFLLAVMMIRLIGKPDSVIL